MTTEPTEKGLTKRLTRQRFGILNPWGDIWTPDTFESDGEAREHLARFWRNQPDKNVGFKVVPVRVTVSVLAAKRKERQP